MTDTFDWAGLVHEVMSAEVTFGVHPASDILRTRIEAAFVPMSAAKALMDEKHKEAAEAKFWFEKAQEWRVELAAATARAEAAEARNKVLEERHARELFDATAHGELKTLEAIARAEAAEARVAELTAQLAEARESERAAMTEVNGLKDALAQVPEFICRKCGRRQDGPTDNEARF